jgi:hypothetical protein
VGKIAWHCHHGCAAPRNFAHAAAARWGRVGKIAELLAIIIPVPGNLSHPTLIGFMESIH